jgi:predicted nuclease of predicted toxin-antitoxin system
MLEKSLKILVDEMHDGMDKKLNDIGYDAYSVKKLRAEGLNLHSDYSVINYAKDNNMILVTRDGQNVDACNENGIQYITLDNDEFFKIVVEKLDRMK